MRNDITDARDRGAHHRAVRRCGNSFDKGACGEPVPDLRVREKNKQVDLEERRESVEVSGMLLYAATDEDISARCAPHERATISATLDLDRPFGRFAQLDRSSRVFPGMATFPMRSTDEAGPGMHTSVRLWECGWEDLRDGCTALLVFHCRMRVP